MVDQHQTQHRRGAILLLVVFALFVVIVMTVLAVDIAYMQLVRTELRTGTDAAARAATETLMRTQDVELARQAALDAAVENRVAANPLVLAGTDVVFGSADPNASGLFTFSPSGTPANAVRISASPGSVPLFLGSILGTSTFQPRMASTSSGIVRDIAIVIDRSGSMDGQKFIDLGAALAAFLAVLDSTPADERVSLASYSDTATKDADMTSSMASIQTAFDSLSVGGHTAIGDGLQIGSNSLEFDANSRQFATKAVVLMTDGIENAGTPVLDVVPTAIARNQSVFTVTFGSGADIIKMQSVADQTQGYHRHATTGTDLIDVFTEIAKSLAVVMIE